MHRSIDDNLCQVFGQAPGVCPGRVVEQRLMTVTYEDARTVARRLAEPEGILCTASSGVILHGWRKGVHATELFS